MFSDISMKRVMKPIGASLIALGLSACAQTPKHTNTLMFATNTDWGVKVGTDEKQIPVIRIGFKRQEGAFVPVFANTSVDGDGEMIPCPSATADTKNIKIEDLEACKFLARSQASKGTTPQSDAYSVLASFGGTASGKNNEAGMTIAQYFATGVAAQKLAESGGANVVAAGGASKEIADAAGKVADAAKAKNEAEKVKYAAEAAKYRKEVIGPAGITIAAKIDKDNNGMIDQSEIDLLDPHVNAAVQANLDRHAGATAGDFIQALSKLIPLDMKLVANKL